MECSTQDLYPIVHDLTDAEYGNTSCCCDATVMMGAYSLEDLAMPVIKPRSVPPSPPRKDCKREKKSHRRGHSLFSFGTSKSSTAHRRSHSSPSAVSEDSATFSCTESEERVTDSSRFEDNYVLTRQIYRCTYSTLWECVHRRNGTRHCAKVIDRRRFLCKSDEEMVLKEIAMLTSLQKYTSPRICKVYQVSEDMHHFYIVMEFVEGVNLASVLSQSGGMSEQRVQHLARSLLEALNELHSVGICHNDLQPDNVLIQNSDDEVFLCDYGCASYVDPKSQQCSFHRKRRYGNLAFTPPEVLLKNDADGLASDMWGVGVILYYCLCGSLPFEDGSKTRLKEKVIRADYCFANKQWRFVTRGAKQFLSSLLHSDPNVRMTVTEALEHPWLSTPPLLVPKTNRRSLVQRLWGKLKRESPEKPVNGDLSTASTFSSMASIEDSTRRKQLGKVY